VPQASKRMESAAPLAQTRNVRPIDKADLSPGFAAYLFVPDFLQLPKLAPNSARDRWLAAACVSRALTGLAQCPSYYIGFRCWLPQQVAGLSRNGLLSVVFPSQCLWIRRQD